ncbi:MAG: hypothetical protein AB1744_16090 [Candidatus Zixiibacteriota bacterium]
MKRLLILASLVWPLSVVVGADPFEIIKDRLAAAACTRIDFLSLLESDVFDLTDTVEGSAYVARDGRFHVTLGPDQYVNDLAYLYSYSSENNQVVIETVGNRDNVSKEISFVTRLDEFYQTESIQPGYSYRLRKQGADESNTPDSLTVFIDRDSLLLKRLEYPTGAVFFPAKSVSR